VSARLDGNAASFSRLVPYLLEDSSADTEVVALDFPGHGLSGHKSSDGPPQLLAEFAYYAVELIEAMEWRNKRDNGGDAGMRTVVGNVQRSTAADEDKPPSIRGTDDDVDVDEEKIILVGHSMGSGVAIVLAAAFPEYFSSLILLEGGLVARNSQDAARHVRAACQRRLKSNRTLFPSIDKSADVPRSKVYRTLDAAVEARMSTAQRMPGEQYLTYDAAKDMVIRATVPAQKTSQGRDSESVVFRHDPRLQWPSLQYYTREQVEAFYRDLHKSGLPVCLLRGEDGFPVDEWTRNSIKGILKPGYVRKLSGSHHLHADPDSAPAVARDIVAFLNEQGF